MINSQNAIEKHHHLEQDEKCTLHPKEAHIAVDDDTGAFACNKCVFEKRVQKPLFIATYARQTKRRYDEMYETLIRNITVKEDITP